MRRVAVIGAGASGMMAAIAASENARVSLFEKNEYPGRKLLQTGNGKCNFLNDAPSEERFRGSIREKGILSPLITFYDKEYILKLFSSFGLLYHKKNGGYYPRSDSAGSVNDVLIAELKARKVDLHVSTLVKNIDRSDGGFFLTLNHLKTNKRSRYEVKYDAVIITTGGKSAPKTGSTGDGYYFAEQFGLKVAPPYPALTRMISGDIFFNDNTVRTYAAVKLFIDGEYSGSSSGELQSGDQGPSGILIFDLSGRASRALSEGRKCHIMVDLLPELDEDSIYSLLKKRWESMGEGDEKTELFLGIFSERLALKLDEKLGRELFGARNLPDVLSDKDLRDIASMIKNMRFHVTGTGDFNVSQVTSGGVHADSLNPDLSAKGIEGLYFAGECLDADGDCGGFNLHFAFASGLAAGYAAGDPDRVSN